MSCAPFSWYLTFSFFLHYLGQFHAGICILACFFHSIWTSIWLKVHKKWSAAIPSRHISVRCQLSFICFLSLSSVGLFVGHCTSNTFIWRGIETPKSVCKSHLRRPSAAESDHQRTALLHLPFNCAHSAHNHYLSGIPTWALPSSTFIAWLSNTTTFAFFFFYFASEHP